MRSSHPSKKGRGAPDLVVWQRVGLIDRGSTVQKRHGTPEFIRQARRGLVVFGSTHSTVIDMVSICWRCRAARTGRSSATAVTNFTLAPQINDFCRTDLQSGRISDRTANNHKSVSPPSSAPDLEAGKRQSHALSVPNAALPRFRPDPSLFLYTTNTM